MNLNADLESRWKPGVQLDSAECMGLSSSSSRREAGSRADAHWNRLRLDHQAWKPSYDKWNWNSDFERGTKNPLGQVRQLVSSTGKQLVERRKPRSVYLLTWIHFELSSWTYIYTDMTNHSDESNSTWIHGHVDCEFRWSSYQKSKSCLCRVRLESHKKDWLSLVNLSKSLMWQMCSEAVSCWASVSI